MKKIVFLIFLMNCYPACAENNSPAITVYGVSGTLRDNIEKRLLELHQLKPLTQLSTEELSEQMLKSLQAFGYFKVHVTVDTVSTREIIASVNLGPPCRITRLTLELSGEGATNSRLRDALNKIPLQKGAPFNSEQYNKSKLNLLDTAESLGYSHAYFKKSEVLIDEEQNSADITLILNTGAAYYFGQVQFDPTYIRPELLHRFTPFHPGELYSTEKLLQFNNELSNSGYFSSVLVKPQITDTPEVPVQVHVEPVPKYSYTLGAGYGTDTGVRGRAALHVIPVNRKGHKFNALAQGSFVQNALQAQYIIPGNNPVSDQYSLTGNYSNLNYTSGYSNAFLFSLAQQHHTTNYQQTVSVNTLYEGFHYSLQNDVKQFLLYPKGNFSFIKKNALLFSPSGYNITINTLAASTGILSTTNFAQASVDAKAALTLDAFDLRLYGHLIQGVTAVSNVNQQPLSLALLLGGMDNLKAYSFNSIGPGKVISYAGFELQKETKKNWYLIGFFDAGSVYNPTPRAFQYDAGGGVMWVSPIGPVKLGLAQAINNHWQRSSNNPRLVISMGPDL